MLYVYAIIPAVHDSLDVSTLAVGDVAAAFVRGAERSPEPTAERVAAHARVVEAIASGCHVLPARFGTTMPDEAALRESLARHHDALAAALERVRGCVELGVRALWPTEAHEPPPAAQSGRAYMLARAAAERRRQERQRAADDVAKRIHPPLAELARDATQRVLPAPDTPLVAAYLVPREDVDHFKRRVKQIDDAHEQVNVICTGPWPPYHFAPALRDAEPEHV